MKGRSDPAFLFFTFATPQKPFLRGHLAFHQPKSHGLPVPGSSDSGTGEIVCGRVPFQHHQSFVPEPRPKYSILVLGDEQWQFSLRSVLDGADGFLPAVSAASFF